jgi:phage-related protein
MKSVPEELKQDISEQDINVAHLLVIILLDGSKLYFTNCNKKVMFYDDDFTLQEFVPAPFKVGTITVNTETSFPQVTLTMSNITRDFSQLVMGYSIDGCDAILFEVSLRKLENPLFRIELFRGVLDKPKVTEENFEISIVAAKEAKGIKLPRRSYRQRCQLVFGRAPECPYVAVPGEWCAKTRTACALHGMTKYFSGFDKVTSSSDIRGVNG